jgi:rfaE bifunctional protein nucleotidyltransferase chain/domain
MSHGSIADLDTAVRTRAALRASGRRLVFTNGCFDLLHPGHIHLLEAARAAGDFLLVGLNSDRSVREIKGPKRPLLSERERAANLAALEAVDAVVVYDEPTPLRLIETLGPDVLVKGADWAPEAIVGREVVERAGGLVVRVELVPGRSTTAVLGGLRAP